MKTRGLAWGVLWLGQLLVACQAEDAVVTAERFRVTFQALSDGEGLPGAVVFLDGTPYGRTGPTGILTVDVAGVEGQTVRIDVQPPRGFRPPSEVPSLQLRAYEVFTAEQRRLGIEVDFTCPPAKRYAALIVTASRFSDLPVLYRGEEIARTDRSGIAHALLELGPFDQFSVQLDTSGNPKIRPVSPRSPVYKMEDNDTYFVFEAEIEVEKPREQVVAPPPPPPPAPPPGPRMPRRF